MKDLKIETVANGFIVRPAPMDHQFYNPSFVYVFSNAGQLTAWMEKWALERKKEMPK